MTSKFMSSHTIAQPLKPGRATVISADQLKLIAGGAKKSIIIIGG